MPFADETKEETATREKAYYDEQMKQAGGLQTVDASIKDMHAFISKNAGNDPMLQDIEDDPYFVVKKKGGCLLM